MHAAVARSTCGSQECKTSDGFGASLKVEMSKKCTPSWHEACFQVKMYEARRSQRTFGDEEKCTPSWREASYQVKCTKHTAHSALLEAEMMKSARLHGPMHVSRSKCAKHTKVSALLEVEMMKSARRHGAKQFPSQNAQSTTRLDHFLRYQCRLAGAGNCAPCQKSVKREGFVAVAKTMAGVGHLKGIWKDACRVAGAVQKTHEFDVLGDQAGDFLKGVAFWSMRSSGLLR